MPAECITGKSDFVQIQQRSQSGEITSGSSYIILTEELFNMLQIHAFMPIASKKVKFWVHLPREMESFGISEGD